jgi:hypothetical protein
MPLSWARYLNHRTYNHLCKRTYEAAIASIMASPIGTTAVRLKIAPQRRQVRASFEIMAPHLRHEVILDITLLLRRRLIQITARLLHRR